jgi:hypothetical protein
MAHEAEVELEVLRPELDDVTEAREARPRVVDGKADIRAEAGDRLADRPVVVDLGSLGQLRRWSMRWRA